MYVYLDTHTHTQLDIVIKIFDIIFDLPLLYISCNCDNHTKYVLAVIITSIFKTNNRTPYII